MSQDRDDELDVPEARVLRALSDEMRERELPEPDFDAMEAVVMARISREIVPGNATTGSFAAQTGPTLPAPVPIEAAKKRRSLVPVAAGIFAVSLAAAAAALFLGRAPAPPAPAPAPIASAEAPRPSAPTQVETGASPATFAREGLASWTVEANSRAEVRDEGDRIVVRLDAGAITVDVVPQKVVERFVVIAGSTRVAVHGTKFRVTRGEGVKVDVERGVVMVGRVGEQGVYRLPAPSSETFTLEGRKTAEAAEPPQVKTAAQQKLPKTAASGAAPAVAPPVDEGTLRARGAAAATECFRESARRIGTNVHLTVDTTLTLVSGERVSVSFDPPISPAVTECVRERVAELRSKDARTVVVPLSLVARP